MTFFLIAAALIGSTPSAWAALDRASVSACARAGEVDEAQVGPPIRFDDRMGVDARLLNGRRGERKLCLYDRSSRRVAVEAVPDRDDASAVPEIVGTTWRLARVGNAVPRSTRAVFFLLSADGRISGSSGCNTFSGRYVLDRVTLRILAPLATTRRGCEPGAMSQERQMLSALQSIRGWSVTREGLLLRTAGGNLLFRANGANRPR